MYGVILIFILVVMGGLIAYIGDKLGTKVGKKKLTIFGLRPKHTSIIFTIITGILITSSTLGVMALSSENVRVALFGMEKLNQQIKETEQNLNQITLQLNQANAEREETVAALNKAQEDYREAERDLTESQEQVSELQRTKERLEEAKKSLDQRVAGLNAARDELEMDVNRLSLLTHQLTEGLESIRVGKIIYSAGEVILNQVVENTGQREQITGDLSNVLQEANQNVLTHLGIKKQLQVLWMPQSEFEEAVKAIAGVDQDVIVRIVAAGNIVYGEPVRAHIELFPNKLVYQEGQKVLSERFTIDKEGEAEAEHIVLAFLKQVNAQAVERGIIPDPLRGSVGAINGAQFYDIVNSIENLRGDVIITAYAADDTNAAGPLRLRIKVEVVE